MWLHSGSQVDQIEAVRLHGGEGVMGAVGVHTPDLPNSLAWLSPKEELTFGDLDLIVQLRWFTLGSNTFHIMIGLWHVLTQTDSCVVHAY